VLVGLEHRGDGLRLQDLPLEERAAEERQVGARREEPALPDWCSGVA
jgi:hypothetical protein